MVGKGFGLQECKSGIKTERKVLATFQYFESDHGGIAQLVERLVRNEKVSGSNPLISTKKSKAFQPK